MLQEELLTQMIHTMQMQNNSINNIIEAMKLLKQEMEEIKKNAETRETSL